MHTARVITELLDQYKWSQLEHPRYSSDLAPCDFWLFPKMKENYRGQRFESEEDIICATKEAIRHLDKDSYVTAFESWLRRMQQCIDSASTSLLVEAVHTFKNCRSQVWYTSTNHQKFKSWRIPILTGKSWCHDNCSYTITNCEHMLHNFYHSR